MGHAHQTIVTTTRQRIRKGSIPKGTHICSSCHGKGWKYNTGKQPKK